MTSNDYVRASAESLIAVLRLIRERAESTLSRAQSDELAAKLKAMDDDLYDHSLKTGIIPVNEKRS